MSKYEEMADIGPQPRNGVGYLYYNDSGVYMGLWGPFDKASPASIICVEGEPVPSEFDDFNDFFRSLKLGSDIKRGDVIVCEKGEYFLSPEANFVYGDKDEWNSKWKNVSEEDLSRSMIDGLVKEVRNLQRNLDVYYSAFGMIPYVGKSVFVEAGEEKYYSDILPKATREHFLSHLEDMVG